MPLDAFPTALWLGIENLQKHTAYVVGLYTVNAAKRMNDMLDGFCQVRPLKSDCKGMVRKAP